MLARIVFAALIAGIATQTLAANDVAARYASTFARIDRRCTDWQFCTDRELPLLWRLAGEFLASQLAAHPGATADDLVAAIKQLDRELEASATKLANGDFVIALQYFETGTVFIVGPAGVKWSIGSALHCWRASCGPYFGSIKLLPSAANGNPRFLVEALHAGNGMTVGAQTSAWRWDGREAHLLAIDKHSEMIDDDRQTIIDGDLVIVPTKESGHCFISSGAAREPAGTWTLRLTANGAKSLGHQWVHPELRWADDFFSVLIERRPVDRFATAKVAREVWRNLDCGVMVTEVRRTGQTVRIATAEGPSWTFTFDPKRAGLYAVAVRFEATPAPSP